MCRYWLLPAFPPARFERNWPARNCLPPRRLQTHPHDLLRSRLRLSRKQLPSQASVMVSRKACPSKLESNSTSRSISPAPRNRLDPPRSWSGLIHDISIATVYCSQFGRKPPPPPSECFSPTIKSALMSILLRCSLFGLSSI